MGFPKHPIFSGATFGLMSGEKPLFRPQVEGGHETLGRTLQMMGLHAEPTSGKYKEPERSYIIHGATLAQMRQLGKLFGQESVVHSQNGQHRLVYTNGPHEGKYHQAHTQNPIEHFEQAPDDFYTSLPGHGHARINFDFNQTHELDPVMRGTRPDRKLQSAAQKAADQEAIAQKVARVKQQGIKPSGVETVTRPMTPHEAANPNEGRNLPNIASSAPTHLSTLQTGRTKKSEREFEPELAAHLMKNALAELLADQAPARQHPHNYDWHDGHSTHHNQDHAAPQLPGLAKAGVHPHMDAPPKPHPTNDQAAGVGVSTYRQFALPYGDVKPGSKPDLLHYNYHGKLPEIQALVQDHGYKTYYAGGKYGKPDLANKNYNTGHLMVYDPSPDSGASFGHQEYTDGWRQIHELSHALTLPELNKIYGEGRRMGKLGTHRNLNEALRAVHWEWLAAHKQRELSKQVGVPIRDEDFHRELNTVMHDAAHRAVTGKFTEPSGEGFTPHAHKVPLHTALQMVRDAGHQMGLKGLHDLIPKATLKSEAPTVIFSKTEGENPVADDKMYTPEEAREILIKAAREKIDLYAKEIEALRTRELKKSLIPNHKHNQAIQAGAGVEDVPPGKVDGKGVDKSEDMAKEELCKKCGKSHELEKCGEMSAGKPAEKAEDMDKAVDKMVVHGDKKVAPAPAGADYTVSKQKDKTVLEAKKSELVDAKGNKKDNHTVAGSKSPEDKKPVHVNKPGKSSKTAGSGGVILPGANLKKAEPLSKPPVSEAQRRAMGAAAGGSSTLGIPKKVGKEFIDADKGGKLPEVKKAATPPTAKPPSGANMGTSVPTSAPKAPAPAVKAEEPNADTGELEACPKCKESVKVLSTGKLAAHECKSLEKAYISPSSKHGLTKPPTGPDPKPESVSEADAAADKKAAGIKKGDFGMTDSGKVATSPAPPAAAPKPKFGAADLAAAKAKLPKPAAPAAKLPGAKPSIPGLASPKAAGVTRSAGPVMNAARPAPAAKPGIFGKLFGKGEAKPGAPKAPDKATQTLFEDPEPKVLHPSDKKSKK